METAQDEQHLPLPPHGAQNDVFAAQLDSQPESTSGALSFFIHRHSRGYAPANSLVLSAFSLVCLAAVYLLASCAQRLHARSVGGRKLAEGGFDPSVVCRGRGEDDGDEGEKWREGEGLQGEEPRPRRRMKSKHVKADMKALSEGWDFLIIPHKFFLKMKSVLEQSAKIGSSCDQLLPSMTSENAYELVGLLMRLAALDVNSLEHLPEELDRSRRAVILAHINLAQETLEKIAAPNEDARRDLKSLMELLWELEHPDHVAAMRASYYRGVILTSSRVVEVSSGNVASSLSNIKQCLRSKSVPVDEKAKHEIRVLRSLFNTRLTLALGSDLQKRSLVAAQERTEFVLFPREAAKLQLPFPSLQEQVAAISEAIMTAGGSRYWERSEQDEAFENVGIDEDAPGSSVQHSWLAEGSGESPDGKSSEQALEQGRGGAENMEFFLQRVPGAHESMMHLVAQLMALKDSMLSVKERLSPPVYLDVLLSVATLATLELGVLDVCPQSVEPLRQQAIEALLDLLAIRLDILMVNAGNPHTVDKIQDLCAILRLIKVKTFGPIDVTQVLAEKYADQLYVGGMVMDHVHALLTSLREQTQGAEELVSVEARRSLTILDFLIRIRRVQVYRCSFARYSLLRAHEDAQRWIIFSEQDSRERQLRRHQASRGEMVAELEGVLKAPEIASSSLSSPDGASGGVAFSQPPAQQGPKSFSGRHTSARRPWRGRQEEGRGAFTQPQFPSYQVQQRWGHPHQQHVHYEGNWQETFPQPQPPPALWVVEPGLYSTKPSSLHWIPVQGPFLPPPPPGFAQFTPVGVTEQYWQGAPIGPGVRPPLGFFRGRNVHMLGAPTQRGAASTPFLPRAHHYHAAASPGYTPTHAGQEEALAASLQEVLRVSGPPTGGNEDEAE